MKYSLILFLLFSVLFAQKPLQDSLYLSELDGVYVGELNLENLPEGTGRVVFAEGGSYEGEWVNGVFHGHGVLVGANGNQYEGTFFRGKKHGVGTMQWLNGAEETKSYSGQWRNDLMHGKGTLKNDSAAIWIKGKWKKGVLQKVLVDYTEVPLEDQFMKK